MITISETIRAWIPLTVVLVPFCTWCYLLEPDYYVKHLSVLAFLLRIGVSMPGFKRPTWDRCRASNNTPMGVGGAQSSGARLVDTLGSVGDGWIREGGT